MIRRLTVLITAKIRSQSAAASTNLKCMPMIALEPGVLRNISGGDGTQSPKGSW